MKTIFYNFKVSFIILLSLFSFSAFAQETTSNKSFEIANKDLKAYVGEYIYDNKAEQGFDITVSLDGEHKLMGQPTNKSQPLSMLSAQAKDKFELTNTGGLIMTFQKDKSDKIISLTITSDGHSFVCIRKEE